MCSDSHRNGPRRGQGPQRIRERLYAHRYPFAADAEILDLRSGTRLSGVTSDLSLGGCLVCTRRSLEIGARVGLTLKHIPGVQRAEEMPIRTR